MRLESFLREAGVRYELCSDPYDALERYKARPSAYSLILMDIRFPEGDLGFEVSKQIAELAEGDAPLPIVGMSGYPNLYRFNGGAEWGMVDILPKPLFKWLVINMVREYCFPHVPGTQG